MVQWTHPFGGVFRRRMSDGTYEVEKSMDDRKWRAWWMPDDDPQERIGLSGYGRKTAREAREDALEHYWRKDEP